MKHRSRVNRFDLGLFEPAEAIAKRQKKDRWAAEAAHLDPSPSRLERGN